MRIVKNKLNTREWEILKFLKENAVGKENAIFGWELAYYFGITTEALRYNIANIREYQDVVIGSNTNVGYYIPLQDEYKEAVRYGQNKALSQLRRNAKKDHNFILRAYKLLNEIAKELDHVSQGQLRMQFNGWENEEENFFGDKYVKEEE